MEQLIGERELEWIMIDASYVKAHMHSCGAQGGNQGIGRTKGGSTPKYIWPWVRAVCQSDALLQMVSRLTAQKLMNLSKTLELED